MSSPRRLLVVIAAAVALLVGVATERTAHADPKKDIAVKIKEAMENFDLLEYEEARKLLNQALSIAKKARLDKDTITAQIHVRLGIVYFAGLQDPEAARVAFLSAVEIDPKAQIEAAYKTGDMSKLLEEARSSLAGGGKGGAAAATSASSGGDGGGCADVAGIEHDIHDSAKSGAALPIEAKVGADVAAAKVAILYRAQGQTDFTEVKMTKSGSCVYTGEIPASAFAGELVHYYVAAFNKAGKVAASKGSIGSPNIIEVAGGAPVATTDDNENPLGAGGTGGRGGAAGGDGGTVAGGVTVAAKKPTVFVAVSAGSGGGFVTGKTESKGSDVECCFAPGLLHLIPEIGVYLSPQMTLSLAGRIGFPLGANIQGHSAVAPGGLLRVRYALSESGNGVQLSGAVGGGAVRNTIKLKDPKPPEMDTDIAAMGPLLVGVGAGYIAGLGGAIKLTAELNTLAALPVVDKIGEARFNFGVQFDVNLGLLVGF